MITNPFTVGQKVIYRPTDRLISLNVMTEYRSLGADRELVVVQVKGEYVVIEGFEQAAGGGLYWTAFAPSTSE